MMNEERDSLFAIFGISMRVNNNWRMYPDNRGQELNYETGFVKFEKQGVRRKKGEPETDDGSISVGLRWSIPGEAMTNDQFIDSYVNQLIASDQKKRFGKTQKTLTIRDQKRLDVNGHNCVFLECEYMASTKLARGTAQKVVVLNLAFLDENSGRIIIGTAMAEDATMSAKKEALERTLFTIACEN